MGGTNVPVLDAYSNPFSNFLYPERASFAFVDNWVGPAFPVFVSPSLPTVNQSSMKNLNGSRQASSSVLAVVLLFGGFFVLKALSSLLQPLFIALFFYFIAMPLIRALLKRRFHAWLAYLSVILFVVGIIVTCAFIIGSYLDDIAAKIPLFEKKLHAALYGTAQDITTSVPVWGRRMGSFLKRFNLMAPSDTFLKNMLEQFVNFLSGSVLVVFYFIFLLHESRTLPRRLVYAYGKERAEKILGVGRRINEGISRYLYIKFLASLLVAVISLPLLMILGLDLAVFWAVVLFVTNFIPYFGSIGAVSLIIAAALAQFSSLIKVLLLGAVLVTTDLVVGNYLEPRYSGYRLNMSPLLVLLSLAFWGWLWGVVGLVLAVPIMVGIKCILENFPATKEWGILMSHVSEKS